MNVLKSFKRFRELYEAGSNEFIGFYLPAANLHETNLKGASFEEAFQLIGA